MNQSYLRMMKKRGISFIRTVLNSHIALNMSCEPMVVRGVKIREPLKKWQFSEILSEELTEFTAVVENDKMTDLHISMPSILEK